jgi:hypothetical protein
MEINLIKRALSNYSIKQPVIKFEQFLRKNDEGQLFNTVSNVIKITTLSGTYVLKKYASYCNNKKKLEKMVQFQLNLKKNGLQIPQYIKSEDGSMIVSMKEKNQLSLFSLQCFSKGYPWKLGEPHLKQAANLLFTYHQLSLQFFNKEKKNSLFLQKNILTDVTSLTKGAYKELLIKKNTVAHSHEKKIIKNFLHVCYKQLLEMSDVVNSREFKENNLIVHGDYNPNNLIYGNNKIEAIIDFDNYGIDNPLNDIIRFILHSCFYNFESFIDLSNSINLSMSKYFLNIYYYNVNCFHKYSLDIVYAISLIISTELIVISILRGYIIKFDDLFKFIELINYLATEITKIFKEIYNA